MNCTEPVRQVLVEVIDRTLVTSDQAALAAGLSRDRGTLQIPPLKVPITKFREPPECPETRYNGGSRASGQPCPTAGKGRCCRSDVKDEHSQSTGHNSQRSALRLSAGKPTDSVGGDRDLTTAGRKMIMPRTTVNSQVEPVLYRVDEAAAALRLSRSSVYELIRSGQLRTVKHGRRRLVPVKALAEYVASLGGAA
jgi:excisionase family DNA binding protein